MQQISELLKYNYIKKKGSERNSVLKELYSLYISDKRHRKIENWKRYIKYLKDNRIPDNKENQQKFKRSKLFIKELSEKSFAILLTPQSLSTLYYMKSVAKDKGNRGENVGAFILGSIKIK